MTDTSGTANSIPHIVFADLPTLQGVLLDILRAHPEGLPEYELLRELENTGALRVPDLSDALALFQVHFSLFHALYTLRELLVTNATEWLEISPIRIRLGELEAAQSTQIDRHDELSRYYLDLSQLRTTDADDVERLLKGFWRRIDTGLDRVNALAILGLEDPVDKIAIKARYRTLVMRHHPDRGGDKSVFQSINDAMRALR